MTIRRILPGPINSRAVIHGDIVYLSGMTAEDKTADLAGQTAQILERIDKTLQDCGTDKSHLLSATVVLADMKIREEMNTVWKAWIDPANPPARISLGAQFATADTLIEIMVIAAL